MRSQWRADPREGGVTPLFAVWSDSRGILACKVQNSLRNCSQVLFLHLRRWRINILNSLGKQAAPATNFQPGNTARELQHC